TLDEIKVVIGHTTNKQDFSYLYTLPQWKAGERLDLQKAVTLERWFGTGRGIRSAEEYLKYAGWKLGESPYRSRGLTAANFDQIGKAFAERIPEQTARDLLLMLLDLRQP